MEKESNDAVCPYCGKAKPCADSILVPDWILGDYAVPIPNAPCQEEILAAGFSPEISAKLERAWRQRLSVSLAKNYPPSRYRYITTRKLLRIVRLGTLEQLRAGIFHLVLGGREIFLLKSVLKYRFSRGTGLFPLGRPHFNAKGKRRQFAVECRWRGKKYAKRKPKWIPWDGKKL